MTAPQPAPFLAYVEAVERHRACTAPDLTPEQFATVCRIEAAEAAPESWTALCSCGRCDGRGALFITTSGAEEWRPHRPDGRTGYLPEAAAGDRWKS